MVDMVIIIYYICHLCVKQDAIGCCCASCHSAETHSQEFMFTAS